MAQGYIIVNLDKKEFINPFTFDDWDKFLMFANSSGGTMLALALLLTETED